MSDGDHLASDAPGPASGAGTGVAIGAPRRVLSLVDVLAIGTNAIIGSGVFAMPDDFARSMGGWSPFVYVACGLLLAPVALCFAELGRRERGNGGPYAYAHEAFGARVGFVVGWACWLNALLAFAANAALLVELCGATGIFVRGAAATAIIAALCVVNYVGVRPSSRLVVLLTVAKVLAICVFAGAALTAAPHGALFGAAPSLRAVGQATFLAIFPLQGFEVVPVPAGETKSPERSIPIATLGSLGFAIVLYVVVQALFVRLVGTAPTASDTPLVAASRLLPAFVLPVVVAGSLVSVGGFTAGSALGTPRYAQAMAHRGQLPQGLARIHARFGTPSTAIVWTGVLSSALAAILSFRSLVGFSNVTVVLQYVATCLAVLKLGASAPMRVLAATGAIGSLALLAFADPSELLVSAGALVLGLLVLLVLPKSSTIAP